MENRQLADRLSNVFMYIIPAISIVFGVVGFFNHLAPNVKINDVKNVIVIVVVMRKMMMIVLSFRNVIQVYWSLVFVLASNAKDSAPTPPCHIT